MRSLRTPRTPQHEPTSSISKQQHRLVSRPLPQESSPSQLHHPDFARQSVQPRRRPSAQPTRLGWRMGQVGDAAVAGAQRASSEWRWRAVEGGDAGRAGGGGQRPSGGVPPTTLPKCCVLICLLAGHSSPTLTARYSHRSLADLAEAVRKLPSVTGDTASVIRTRAVRWGAKRGIG
jgi:hypothetical protein